MNTTTSESKTLMGHRSSRLSRQRMLVGFAAATAIGLLVASVITQGSIDTASAAPQTLAAADTTIAPALPINSTLADVVSGPAAPITPTFFSVAPNTIVNGLGSRLVVTVGIDGSKAF